jgi:DNA-binding protein HU-beta
MRWTRRIKTLGTPAMNTSELVAKIAGAHGVSKAQAKSIVEDIFKDIVDAAASGAEVSLPGFGKFKVKATPEREGRNPANGEKIKIAASKKLIFSSAKTVKDVLNG